VKNTLTLAAASLLFSISVNEEAPKAATSERLKMTESQEKPIVVAVIDTGVDLTHPMIKDYIWMNENQWIYRRSLRMEFCR
jgi:subtilisin family serine protease